MHYHTQIMLVEQGNVHSFICRTHIKADARSPTIALNLITKDLVIKIRHKNMEGREAEFSYTSFAEGRFRRAYKGVWTAPPQDNGRACVVKELKDDYTWKATDWEVTLEINKQAKDLSAKFTSQCDIAGMSISFTDVHVMIVVSDGGNPNKRPKLNEYVTCEDYIPGKFNKWCSNYGYISNDSSILSAFMHWSWIHTRGEEMISDLQGVQSANSYTLTNAVMLSLSSEKYGATNMGAEGMAMFFHNHKCNSLCECLSKPTPAQIIPQQNLTTAQTFLADVKSSTTYTKELKFPSDIRGRVEAKFREIACK